ncbi:TrbG/VirB9 family P-type conjugative transfer protein [Acidithiobacillus ferrooxidans]|uniref:TrbG/VirB9 family P-type conjugative transfer protein n=1 Tax=Acidithiobacillus ferrooxidans TaxID=920 RepID=UPI000A56EE1E
MNKKHIIIAAVAILTSPLALAQVTENSKQVYDNLVRNPVPGTASAKTLQGAIRQASEVWHDTGTASAIAGNNGEVLYPYGQSTPDILCSPLHTTIIKLLPGEKIAGSALGDKIRWTATNLQLGDQAVVLVRPMQKNITTNLVVASTSGKIYDLTLVSDQAKFVPTVGFYDPQREWDKAVVGVAMQNQANAAAQRKATMTLPNINPADLDFSYYVTGPHRYRPIRIFSAAGKVYLQMPPGMKYGNAPAVFVMENGKEQLTNFQMIGSYYVIDQLFHEAKLLLGTGDHKRVVTIHAGNRPSGW